MTIIMNKEIELFARSYLEQNPIPLTVRYQYNDKIILTLQLVDKGIVVGYQDFRMSDHENNIAMQFSKIHFKEVKVGKTVVGNRIDNFIDKFLLPKKSKDTSLELIGNKLQETINFKTISFESSLNELIIAMMEVGFQAQQIYFINSGLKQATERRRVKE